MKIARKGLLAALAILWAFSVCAAADAPPINGFYYQDELSKPLPGALITLYKADDNLLVDSTYTRHDGAFTLKGPAAKGKYYIVATKDQFSHKLDFDYDPQAQPLNLMVQHHQPESNLKSVLDYVWKRLVEVMNLVIGFIAGLGFKWYEDRRKARHTIRREIKTVEDSSAEIVNDYEELEKIAAAYGQSESRVAAEKREEFKTLATKIGTKAEALLKELTGNTALQEAIYTRYKLTGRNNYAALQKAVRDVKKLTETIVAKPEAVLNASDRDAQLKPFRTFRDNDLLKNY
jgi:hypothetical protein